MRKSLLFLCGFLLAVSAFAQYTLTGIVHDKSSRQPVAGVLIGFENMHSFSDENGFFEIMHDGAQREVLVMASGYKTERFLLRRNSNAALFPELRRLLPSGKTNYFKRSMKSGYFNLGKIDIGNISEIYRDNEVEGTRWTLPLQTSTKFSKHIRFTGLVGYGLSDEKWKYGVGAQFLLPTEQNQFIEVSYLDDIFQIGSNRQQNLLRGTRFVYNDNSVIGNLLLIHRDYRLNRREEWNTTYDRSWSRSFSSIANLRLTRHHEGMFVPFGVDYFDNQALTLNATWHFGERFFDGFSSWFWNNNLRPIVQFGAELGNFTINNKNRQYAHFRASIQQGVLTDFGKLNYTVETGYIAGRVPFPLLQIPRGNESYRADDYSFSMMNYMEFAADTYAGAYADYAFDNLLLARIPLIKLLGLKEFVSAKATVGSLRDEHNELMKIPYFTEELGAYAEVGVGIANIFQLFTIESVWRLTDREKDGITTWGVRLRRFVQF
jgi:hypothetical protein